MKSWIACSNYLILFLSLSILCLGITCEGKAQSRDLSINDHTFNSTVRYSSQESFSLVNDTTDTTEITPGFPDPNSVMYKSMMIPGWGQIVNKQAWKVPLVYGLLGGISWYSVYLTKKYHDYRAAHYNLNPQITENDFRFGETPDYIPEDTNPSQLRSIRNTYRNRRDLAYIGIVLAYGLNIVDAYVFAHMRSFDVSEDLSMRTRIKPTMTAQATPGITLSVDFITK